ncbi:MAG: VWA domain-containing protein [Planctomycetes bacterium]|nr:VWA domain-containing protein [Planctomycetota bacterium]
MSVRALVRSPLALLAAHALLVLFAVLATPRGAQAAPSREEWDKLKADALRAFGTDDAAARVKALEGVAKADSLDAAKLLLALLDLPDRALQLAEKDRDEYEPEFDKALEQITKLAKQGKGKVLSTDLEQFEKKEKKMVELHAQVKALSAVQDAIAAALGRLTDEAATKWLATDGLKDKNWRARVVVAQVLAGAKAADATVNQALAAAAGDKSSPQVRAAALDALGKRGAKDAAAAVLAALKDERWQVRVAAVEAIGALDLREGVGPLIDRLQQEAGRLREDIDRALLTLTGVTFRGDPLGWKGWWEMNREAWEAGKLEKKPEKKDAAAAGGAGGAAAGGGGGGGGAEPGKTVTFYGIETKSKNLIFVVDISGSMAEETDVQKQVTSGSAGGAGAGPKGKRKIDIARYELSRAIGLLPDDAKFNIITFSSDVKVYSPSRMIVATKGAKAEAQRFAEALEPEGQTNIYDALEKAFELVGGHKQIDENYKGGVDTIFFLTDGQPTAGKSKDPKEIADEVKKWNAVRKIRIHAIGIGRDAADEILRRLAEESGGTYVKR